MSVNWSQSEICIAINDKSQGSIAKHLSYGGLLYYKYITQFAGERIFKISEHLAKLQAVSLIDRVIRPIRLGLLSSKMQTRQISKLTCV